ncbi:hypothetical protein FNV43_RR26409 [Rhamnella rubrinervis]|uniref:Uncharacterized protein n=1 Tax=Rhamnella rubrinervis TaxID=2594499 RepID=A0A8K0DUX8_9ROSA|nr:hypothetical protein FNV43_RR26409 [Rhamnella rubrinervis]
MGGDVLTLPGTSLSLSIILFLSVSRVDGEDPLTHPLMPTCRGDSSVDHDFPQLGSSRLSDGSSMKFGDAAADGESGLVFQEFDKEGCRFSSASLDIETNQRRRDNVYREILRSFDELQVRSKGLEEARSKILSYTPGGWLDNVGSRNVSDYDVPKTTSLILVGPEGSGKSSLVNRISKLVKVYSVVADNPSIGDGTCFLHEYMIPRGSTSFCLYDTRSLSDDSHDNIKMIKRWMTNGVRNGELVIRDSDSPSLKSRIKCKASGTRSVSREIRKINFVIFVVNGLSVLKCMDNDEGADTRYTQLIASTFNCPYFSFGDDKPLVVITHGDLLSRFDRAFVRVHLGELLGIPPTKQIFDIPESDDPITKVTIIDMLRYSLEHTEKNLPQKQLLMSKVLQSLSSCIILLMIIGIAISVNLISARMCHGSGPPRAKFHKVTKPEIPWHKIRHLWLE